MRISDWSSDVCSSDLLLASVRATPHTEAFARALEAGAILLWVGVADETEARTAEEILNRHGASDVHRHARQRPPQTQATCPAFEASLKIPGKHGHGHRLPSDGQPPKADL